MQKVTILCTGKLKEKFYLDAAAEYAKRLSRFCKLEICELPEERLSEDPSPAQIEAALSREADAVRAKLPTSCLLIAMCVEGKERSSEELARYLADSAAQGASHIVFLIGSSYGMHASLKRQAALRLSMSPHDLSPPPAAGHAAGTDLPRLSDQRRKQISQITIS